MFPQDQVRQNQTSRLVRSEGCASAIRLQTSNVSELSGHLVQMISDMIRPLVTFLMNAAREKFKKRVTYPPGLKEQYELQLNRME